MEPTPGEAWPEEAAARCRDIQLLSKTHRHPEAGPSSAGDWTNIHVSGPRARLNFRMEATPSPSAIQSKASPQIHFAFIQRKKIQALTTLVLSETEAFPQDAGALSIRNEGYGNFVSHAELWGPTVYFSTLLSVQSTTSFVASLYLWDGKTIFPFFTDKDLLVNITRLGN